MEHVFTIPEALAGQRLDHALAVVAQPALSRTAIQRLIQAEQVVVAGLPVRSASSKVRGGETVVIQILAPAASSMEPENIPLDIRFEDAHLVVVNKPAGMVVHPGAGTHHGTLAHALLYHCGATLSGIGGHIRPGIVHRLDKETSGLLVAAKNDATHQGLAEQFKAHSVLRHYLAVVKGVPRVSPGEISAPIGRHPTVRTKMAVREEHSRHAVTHFTVLEAWPAFALLRCRLETGRTHQIRVHMTHLGHPLVGDPVYGGPLQLSKHWPKPLQDFLLTFARQALHAATLGFRHPITAEPLRFQAEPPDDFQSLLGCLRLLV